MRLDGVQFYSVLMMPRPWSMTFVEQTNTVLIDARPLEANLMLPFSGFASNFVYQTQLKPANTTIERRGRQVGTRLNKRGISGIWDKIKSFMDHAGDLLSGVTRFFEDGVIEDDFTKDFNMDLGDRKQLLSRS